MSILAVQCDDLKFIFRIVHYLMNIIRFAVPILLIALISFDLFKAMTQKSDDEMKKATSTIFQRLIWAVLVFFVPMIIKAIFTRIAPVTSSSLSGPLDWIACYNSSAY